MLPALDATAYHAAYRKRPQARHAQLPLLDSIAALRVTEPADFSTLTAVYIAHSRLRHLAYAGDFGAVELGLNELRSRCLPEQCSTHQSALLQARGQVYLLRAYGAHLQRAHMEAAARMVDEIAKPFADHADIQRERAEAWCSVAWWRAQMPEQRAHTEAAARIVDEIAKPFADHADIQFARAEAWRIAVGARTG